MPLIIPTNSISAGGYDVANSLRFNGGSSDDLVRTPGATPTSRYKGTLSVWVKRSRVDEEDFIFYGFESSSNRMKITFKSNNQFQINTIQAGTNKLVYETNRLFRDVSAWYHIVIAIDSTLATAGDRCRLYINGVEETSFATETDMPLNGLTFFTDNGTPVYIGSQATGNYFDGYMAEYVLIDGQQLDPTSFGEFDEDTGIWKPIDVSGLTFGTNGFYLDFENSGSLGADVSGNGNNFTVNNLTSIDQTTDTPTNNYCTLNFLETHSSSALSEGNLFLTSGDGYLGAGTMGVASGKWYFECKITQQVSSDNGHPIIGIINENTYAPSIGSPNINAWAIKTQGASYNGKKSHNGTDTATDTTFANDDIVMVAFDVDNSKVWFGKNGTWVDSGDPATDSNPAFSNLTGTFIRPLSGGYNSSVAKFNFGNPPFTISSGNSDGNGYGNFEYAVPSGYYALNTKNLSEFG